MLNEHAALLFSESVISQPLSFSIILIQDSEIQVKKEEYG